MGKDTRAKDIIAQANIQRAQVENHRYAREYAQLNKQTLQANDLSQDHAHSSFPNSAEQLHVERPSRTPLQIHATTAFQIQNNHAWFFVTISLSSISISSTVGRLTCNFFGIAFVN